MINILRSKIVSLSEIIDFGQKRDLWVFLNNKIIINGFNEQYKQKRMALAEEIYLWLENNCQGKVAVERHKFDSFLEGGEQNVSLYFELDTDLTFFMLRWKNSD